MQTLEAKAADIGRTLLLLDTETGSYAESFYRQRGWIEFGVVPGHTVDTRGEMSATTYFMKQF